MSEKNSWASKHIDTIIVLGALAAGWWNLSGRFFDLDKRLNELENRLTRIETVFILQKMMPPDMCKTNQQVDKNNP